MRVRSRNRFVIVVIIIAIVLVLAAILAYMVLVKKPERRPVPPKRPPPPPPVQPFPERGPEKWAQVDKPDSPPVRKGTGRKGTGRRPRPETIGDSAISGVMRRLAAGFNQCARKHGGVDGSVVRVGFSVSPSGGVQSPHAMSPHRRTPLGRCIANTLGGAQFGRSEFGRSDVRWSITLHP
ncbi:MAG: hypothetical protein AAGF11_45395 [Myxococcota bacterium]